MINVTHLSKHYGATWALSDVSLTIDAGDMFGLIGPNGAGKTTLIRILATLLKPTTGSATIDGCLVSTGEPKIRRLIGYLPDFFGVYEDMRVREYLEFFAAAYGVKNPRRAQIVQGVLELTDLAGKKEEIIGTLSRGMQQRLGLARVLVHDPKVLLLDEPASGLDPRARIEIRELLKELRRMGKTILISSHILADLADLCNKIGLIEKGKLLYAGEISKAMEMVQSGDVWIVEVAGETERALAVLRQQAFVRRAELNNGHILVSTDGHEPDAIPRILVQEGLRLRTFHREDVTLEDAFMRLTKGEVS
ncbi:MAG: ABC transporter ATP-binding protein [Planctomycetes bacterium]|nr:ABC transporter ATP-binding protein [Planctomycetota bacterium]